MEFIGSKRGLADFITSAVERECGPESHVADLFCGTAAVSSALRASGHRVIANDHLRLCSTFAEAALLYEPTSGFQGRGSLGYLEVLAEFNSLSPDPGFVHDHYSPAGGRMYLTEANAARVDAIRSLLRKLGSSLARGDRARLLADLVIAVSRVSNTAGTYGCYLKHWKSRALQPLTLVPASSSVETTGHEVHCTDAEALAPQLEAAAVYADPPYTKRQYAAYYHVLETIVVGDEPTLVGSTGLRPWREKASDWCYRRRAPDALRKLVDGLRCEHFFLSYSEDGQIPDAEIREILSSRGPVAREEVAYPRYRSNRGAHKGRQLRERLYHLALD